jgi:kynurenine formamidase
MIPAYDDLPVHEQLGLPYSWGLLDPNLGTLGLTSHAATQRAACRVEVGESVLLSIPLDLIDPPLFGRAALHHSVHQSDRNTFEDVIDSYNPQSASQWDGFRHVRAREFGYFGGIDAIEGSDRLGIEHFARRGVVGRGVLLDVARWLGPSWDPLSPDVVQADALTAVAAHQGVEMEAGDVLCIRLGWLTAYRSLTRDERAHETISRQFAGLRSDDATARFLWDHRVAAVCTDNPAVESAPGNRSDGSLHRRLLPMLGVVMGELFDLDRLSVRCADLGRYDFLFIATPLGIPGGLSSPANAVAIL